MGKQNLLVCVISVIGLGEGLSHKNASLSLCPPTHTHTSHHSPLPLSLAACTVQSVFPYMEGATDINQCPPAAHAHSPLLCSLLLQPQLSVNPLLLLSTISQVPLHILNLHWQKELNHKTTPSSLWPLAPYSPCCTYLCHDGGHLLELAAHNCTVPLTAPLPAWASRSCPRH